MFNVLIMFTHGDMEIFSVLIMFTDGDIQMSDNTAYGTTHHTHVTCADESPYEDVNKL